MFQHASVHKATSIQDWIDGMGVEELGWSARALILIPSNIFGMSWIAVCERDHNAPRSDPNLLKNCGTDCSNSRINFVLVTFLGEIN